MFFSPRLIGLFLTTCCLLGPMESAVAGDDQLPNVIVILADDLGYGDLGCYGATDIHTPCLDRMAGEGTRFTDFSVTAPLCTPSRVSLMTGCYPGRFGLATGVLRPDARTGVPAEAQTLAELFHAQGYVTSCIGKWHLGFKPGMRPLDQGFDRYFGVLHNLDHYETDHFTAEGGMPVLRNDQVVDRPAIPARMTALYTQEALEFIKAHTQQPFFLYIGHQMPHLPFDASDAFKGRSARGLYGDVVEELDWSTGQILDALREHDIARRTLVLFTSDNGPVQSTPGTAAPFQGGKHTVWEGGIRVPLVAWWPQHVPAGRVCDEFISCLDVFPTLAELAKSKVQQAATLDGWSFADLLLGKPESTSLRSTLYVLYGLGERRRESYRSGNWKLHLTDPPQLYDLQRDISESQNVASQHPEIVKRLHTEAQHLQSTVGSP